MLGELLKTALFIFVCILAYRFHRPVLARLKRFDEENVARIHRQSRERTDPNAHIRHALDVADEQVEEIREIAVPDARTGIAVTHYMFEVAVYATRDEAEEARARRIGVIARRFYDELPRAMMGDETPSTLTARERAARRWDRTPH